MTARQRQGTGNGSAVLSAPAGMAEVKSDRAGAFSWDDWFQHASPQQRAAALGIARQQGLLYPHQLPAVTNGKLAPAQETDVSTLLARVLAGKTEMLTPPALAPISLFDTELDPLQQQAIQRALASPDVFMLHGLPGAGKSRVLAEFILQAARQGRRILFLAGHTASLDVVLERLVGRAEVFPLRFLDAAEKIEALPPWLRDFTLEQQKQAFLERILSGARGNREEAESACRQRRDLEPVWAELSACLDQWLTRAERSRDLQARLPEQEAAVAKEAETSSAGAFADRLKDLQKRCDVALETLDAALQSHKATLAQCDQDSAACAERLAALEPSYQAKKHTRFWTAAFWATLFNGAIIQEAETLLAQLAEAQSRRQQAAAEMARLDTQRQTRLEQWQTERDAVIRDEIETRKQELLCEQRSLDAEICRLDEQWNYLCRRLEIAPPLKTLEGLAAGQQAWLIQKQYGEDQCQFAQQWAKFVEETGPHLATRLPGFANLLAGTIQRFHTDPKFREAAAVPTDFVLIEDADALTDADVLHLARLGRRCVLVSQALVDIVAPAAPKSLPTPLTPIAWQRLWSALGGNANDWPCTWRRDNARLVCRLVPLNPEDRPHLETERLADAPDIELGILHRPRTRPCLAQVTFPPNYTFAEAFHFLMREVQEFALEPVGRTCWWSEDDERVVRHFGSHAHGDADRIDIEPGVHLETANTTQIGRIVFAKAAGWNRDKASAWLARHRPIHDCERTAFLQTPYRYQVPLAQVVRAVIRVEDWLRLAEPVAHHDAKHFEFVAVPPLQKPDWPREGAGLELDLSASRHAEHLPTGLRHGLPARGFVNYLEAQALIRRLEMFLQKDVNGHPCRVAVLALYEGQVELLRRLMAQSEALRNSRLPLEVSLPSRWHQRECDVVFLSLTRSHGHRAVAFGEDVRELPVALTRARSRLVAFGDPGALCKRIHWQGPLDHLDTHSAHQELQCLSRLVAFLQSHHAPFAPANGKR